jgi:hypothetical protein
MALIKCKECGQQISSDAKACPSCGKPTPPKTKLSTWLIGGLGALVMVSCIISQDTARKNQPPPPPPPETAEQKVEREKRGQDVRFAVAGANMLKKSMRNPDSFKLDSVFMIDGQTALCYEYRAQNGFGGVNAAKAVIDINNNQIKTSEPYSDAFVRAWNKVCAGKSSRDLSAAVKRLAQ